MPQSYDFIFISARDFGEKLLKKLGSYALYQGKNLCESVKSVGVVLCPTDFTDSHRFTQILGLDLKSRR